MKEFFRRNKSNSKYRTGWYSLKSYTMVVVCLDLVNRSNMLADTDFELIGIGYFDFVLSDNCTYYNFA